MVVRLANREVMPFEKVLMSQLRKKVHRKNCTSNECNTFYDEFLLQNRAAASVAHPTAVAKFNPRGGRGRLLLA